MELHEGLAEYTGIRAALDVSQRRDFVFQESEESARQICARFVRSSAYLSGPAYGLLLDSSDKDWIHSLSAKSDLGSLLIRARGLRLVENLESHVNARSRAYGGAELWQSEKEKDDRPKGNCSGLCPKAC